MKNRASINMVQNSIDPNNALGIKRFSHLEITHKYQYPASIEILMPARRFLNTIIDVEN